MRRATVDPHVPDAPTMQEAAAILRAGGVVAYPTETVYGLAVDPRSDTAVRRLFGIKARDAGSPVALIAADSGQADEVGAFGHRDTRMAAAFWPGPLTIVVTASPHISTLLLGSGRSVGVRVSAHPVARALASAFGGCITATSANLSGQPPASTASQVAAVFAAQIDLLVDAGPTPDGPPSTVVQIIDGVPTLHRLGAIAWDRVLRSLE